VELFHVFFHHLRACALSFVTTTVTRQSSRHDTTRHDIRRDNHHPSTVTARPNLAALYLLGVYLGRPAVPRHVNEEGGGKAPPPIGERTSEIRLSPQSLLRKHETHHTIGSKQRYVPYDIRYRFKKPQSSTIFQPVVSKRTHHQSTQLLIASWGSQGLDLRLRGELGGGDFDLGGN
jgi:hypothetical protein